jgi:hypothetical protein
MSLSDTSIELRAIINSLAATRSLSAVAFLADARGLEAVFGCCVILPDKPMRRLGSRVN